MQVGSGLLCLGWVNHPMGLCADRQNDSHFKRSTLGYQLQAPLAISTSETQPFYLGKYDSLPKENINS